LEKWRASSQGEIYSIRTIGLNIVGVRAGFPIRKLPAWKVFGFEKNGGSRNLGCARLSQQTQFAEETTALS